MSEGGRKERERGGGGSMMLVLEGLREYIMRSLHLITILTRPTQCLTVPAIWSDRAKSTMREAAVRSGIVKPDDHPERLMLISEPEAAALYCEKKCDQWNLKHGNTFMICDAGGGTVDLIVYEIEDTSAGRTLKEVTSGHGGACGSVFLDNNMRRLLAYKFRDYMAQIPACAFESMMDSFVETVKPGYDGNEDQFINLPASANLDQLTDEKIGLEDGVLRLPASELKTEVFDPVILQVLELMEQQISQVPGRLDAIFLVGGFGSSDYLYDRVRAQFDARVRKIAAPPRGELAVVRGAVYFGLNPRVVTSKISRRSYGVMTRMTFEEGKDPEESAVVTNDGIKRISKNFWITYPKNTEGAYNISSHSSDLYAYDDDPPIPRQVTDRGITKIADFPIEIPHLPSVKIGDRVDMRIDFIFSLTELRIEALVNEQRFVFTSKFEATDVYGA
ncbi:hypothetical protein BC936DRAFT_149272 [Jimgerdemannia flammicorona]|uniref:Actin-like ATPase domain-containing protein n=1 Tax=Jimgerdemannia flammicorona TaxID=994334 RepID=A0A433DK20_9FUNG|nr:hypothetical protein BC936DRAFT_149272 [Jimgerdemannia flammicorona]